MFTSRDIQILERLGMAAFVIDSDNVVLATKQISELPFFSFVPDAPMSVNVRRTDIREALLTRDSFAIMSPTRERNFQVDRFAEENTLIVVRETTSKVEQTEQVNILIYHVVHEIRNALNIFHYRWTILMNHTCQRLKKVLIGWIGFLSSLQISQV